MTRHPSPPTRPGDGATARLAYFVTAHGFGHATRAAAVMAALQALNPALHFDIFSQVPRWLFEDSLRGPFGYDFLQTDIGLVQTSSLQEDLSLTVQSLNAFLPFDEARVARLAEMVRQRRCVMMLCDIAPLGIAVAQAAGLPAVLIENFTWDWIYAGYASEAAELRRHTHYLRGVFAAANYHVQVEPVCAPVRCDLTTPPVSRKAHRPAVEVRAQLGIPPEAKMVLLTMGGVAESYTFLPQLQSQAGVYFVIPGASAAVERNGQVVLLPHRSEFFHPDLVAACDAVVGKLGYSLLAEAYHAGVPFGYVTRPRFRETATLAAFAQNQLDGLEIPAAQFYEGGWLAQLPALLAWPRRQRHVPNGADQAAEFVARLL